MVTESGPSKLTHWIFGHPCNASSHFLKLAGCCICAQIDSSLRCSRYLHSIYCSRTRSPARRFGYLRESSWKRAREIRGEIHGSNDDPNLHTMKNNDGRAVQGVGHAYRGELREEEKEGSQITDQLEGGKSNRQRE